MRIGVCASIDNIRQVEEAGYDYIEDAVTRIAGYTPEEFKEKEKQVVQSSIKVEVCNIFLPADLKVVGENVDYDKIKEYVKKASDRISSLGTRAVVFGSGGARRVPEGFSKEKAYDQLEDFLHMTSDIIRPYGITIVIEPLPLRSCNIINDVLEGLYLAKRVNRDNIRLLADYFHMVYHRESLDNIEEAGAEYIKHIHINNPYGGGYPKIGDKVRYSELFDVLKKIGYGERISLEAYTKDFDNDIIESFRLLRQFI